MTADVVTTLDIAIHLALNFVVLEFTLLQLALLQLTYCDFFCVASLLLQLTLLQLRLQLHFILFAF
jgi:hypothetical protein